MIEDGVAALDAAARPRAAMRGVGWEAQRVALLRGNQQRRRFRDGPRRASSSSLYNQKEVWPIFGYEGESSSKGGYINRGFNDIDWL